MRFAAALDELNTRQPEHMPEPDLDRIRALAELLDDPQLSYPTIHVTGTNGKTTTARLAAALACEHGLSTGLFTSPHLTSVTERFVVCGERMSEDEFGEEYERLTPFLAAVDERVGRVTYFEALTGLGYLWFADKPVGLGVFEVGMGGEWDATNLIAGDVAVMCPIAMDHVAELGPTLADIAREKAGVVKQGKVAVVRDQEPEALAVIRDRCEEMIASMVLEGREWALESRAPAVGGQSLTVHGLGATYEDLLLPIHGEHVAHSAAAAIAAVEGLLERPLDAEAVRRAFEGATAPGRLEVVARHPLIVLDGAHNPGAAAALAAALPETFTWERLRLVAGVFSNKDLEGIAERLAPLADQVYACATGSVRARPPSEVADAFGREGVPARAFGDVREALDAARADAGAADLILVTGSLYTVADARRALVPGAPPEVRGRDPAQEEP
jgi:dihydrofolate synthase / folylpolyglutamate synthase